jgi:hypothetical protein
MKELLTSPATLRVLLCILAPIVGMVPGVSLDQVTHILTINFDTALTGASAGAAGAFAVYAKFGKR